MVWETIGVSSKSVVSYRKLLSKLDKWYYDFQVLLSEDCCAHWTGHGQGYFYQISKGGHLRYWTFSKTNFGPFLTKDAKLWTFLYGVWFRGLEILQNIQNCGPFSTLRGSEVQLFLKKYKILDLFLKVVVWTSRYLTKHPKLWTFLVSHWVRGPDILQKIQSCGPFSLAHGPEVHDIPQSIQNCGSFFPTRGSEV